MFILLFTVIFLLLVTFGISYYIVHWGLSPSDRNEKETYDYMYSEYPHLKQWVRRLNSNQQLSETYIWSDDSLKLHGYFIPADKPTNNTAIVIHGHKNCAVGMLHIAYMYSKNLHFNVLLPELRAHGGSEGDHIGMGWEDRKDIQRWIAEAPRIFNNDSLKIVVHGISMGAATTMMLAGDKTPDYVICFVEDCGFTSAWDAFSYVANTRYHCPTFPFMHLANRISKWMYGFDMHEASAIEQIKKAEKPMLFIHGQNDHYVPYEMVHELYKAKPRNKFIWEAPNARHARSYHDYPREYTQQVKAFVNSYLYK